MATKKKATKKTAKKTTKRTAKKATSAKPKSNDICFTIMPFGGWFDDYYVGIYKPAIEAAGVNPKRADDMYRPSTIVNDIWEHTQKAKLVLADLTGKNPNVFYELGLAHALAKPAILITESMDDVPFDLRALRVIEYDKNRPNWGDSLQSDITQSIKEILESPLESVLPAFLSVKSSPKKRELTKTEREMLEIKSDLDAMRREIYSSKHFRNRRIGVEEAKDLIQSYVESNIPTKAIINRLVKRGAPEGWVTRQIADIQEQELG